MGRWGSDGCPEDDDDFWYDDEDVEEDDAGESGEEEFPVEDAEVEVEPCVEPVKVSPEEVKMTPKEVMPCEEVKTPEDVQVTPREVKATVPELPVPRAVVPANSQTGEPTAAKDMKNHPSPATQEPADEMSKGSGQESSKTSQEMSAPTAAVDSKVDESKPGEKTPTAVEREAAISPQEQETLVTGREPKRRGRKPNPEPKAKAKAKAKARSKAPSKREAAPAATSSRKGKKPEDAPRKRRSAKSKGKTMTTPTPSDEHEEDPPQPKTSKTRRLRKAKSKVEEMGTNSVDNTTSADMDRKDQEVDNLEEAPSSSSSRPARSSKRKYTPKEPSSKKAAPKPKAARASKKKDAEASKENATKAGKKRKQTNDEALQEITETIATIKRKHARSPEYKKLLSRKSCAYKKARNEALKEGKSPEAAAAAGKKAAMAPCEGFMVSALVEGLADILLDDALRKWIGKENHGFWELGYFSWAEQRSYTPAFGSRMLELYQQQLAMPAQRDLRARVPVDGAPSIAAAAKLPSGAGTHVQNLADSDLPGLKLKELVKSEGGDFKKVEVALRRFRSQEITHEKGGAWVTRIFLSEDQDGDFFDNALGSITDNSALLSRVEDGEEGLRPEDHAANSSVSFKLTFPSLQQNASLNSLIVSQVGQMKKIYKDMEALQADTAVHRNLSFLGKSQSRSVKGAPARPGGGAGNGGPAGKAKGKAKPKRRATRGTVKPKEE
eukprot:s219_g26.t2